VTELPAFRATLKPDWIDYNGHLRDAYYVVAMSLAVDEVMDHLGLDAHYRERTRCTLYTLELHIHYLHEIKATDELSVATSVLDYDAKRIHAACDFRCPRIDGPAASADLMLMHVHQGEKPAGAPFPAEVAARLESLKASPAEAAARGFFSRKIEIKRR
jgi:acyl-CoA thioester hydrolase